MKCEICKERDSILHVQQTFGTEIVDMHLCEICAHERGISSNADKIELSLSHLLTGLLDIKDSNAGKKMNLECKTCGTKIEDFKKEGRLGCPGCYSVFAEEIRSVYKKMSVNVNHRGKLPKKLLTYKELLIDKAKLKELLKDAVNREDYEKAAIIRDQIQAIELPGGVHD